MNCICGKELKGELDTFGPVGCPMCWPCYSASQEGYSYYGLGPHHHDISITGSLVGSTVFDDQDVPGFYPDPDAPGLGVWMWKGWL